MVTPEDVIFLGIEAQPTTWYRCAQPARALGCDWVGVDGEFKVVCGEAAGEFNRRPDMNRYKVAVVQLAAGEKWLERIVALRRSGCRVLYEVDDYLHGIAKVEEHRFRKDFTRQNLRAYEMCMAACDGMIVSTKFLVERYRRLSPGPIYLCRNGIDPARYALSRPPRGFMTVGWAGGIGHVKPLLEWLNGGMLDAIRSRDGTRLMSVGMNEPLAEALVEQLPGRSSHVPWIPFETYPAALLDADVVIAPAGDGPWYRGKSDLRWLEASALGLPCISDPRTYPEADLAAVSPSHAVRTLELMLDDPDYARQCGLEAQEHVLEHRAFPGAAEPWRQALGVL